MRSGAEFNGIFSAEIEKIFEAKSRFKTFNMMARSATQSFSHKDKDQNQRADWTNGQVINNEDAIFLMYLTGVSK